jgi:AraC-like DNA-binding protein
MECFIGGNMRSVFEPILLDGKHLIWNYKNRSEFDFPGFYHWHQCCEMLFVHEGQGSIIVNSKNYEIRQGMLFFFQPFQLHKVFANVSQEYPYVRSILHFDPYFAMDGLQQFPSRSSFFNQLWYGQNIEQAFDLIQDIGHMERIFKMVDHSDELRSVEIEEESKLLLFQLINSLSMDWKKKESQSSNVTESRLLRYSEIIMQWIEKHYAEEVCLDDLSVALHLSKFYVSRVFSQETGSSITDYLTTRRIKQACRLLQTTMLPIERIGIEIGYPNASYFIRLFKLVVGMTPLKYRKENLEKMVTN